MAKTAQDKAFLAAATIDFKAFTQLYTEACAQLFDSPDRQSETQWLRFTEALEKIGLCRFKGEWVEWYRREIDAHYKPPESLGSVTY